MALIPAFAINNRLSQNLSLMNQWLNLYQNLSQNQNLSPYLRKFQMNQKFQKR